MKMKLGKDSGHIHLPVYLNEKGPFDFTLDTGAGMTVISKALADQLGIKTYQGSKTKAAGVGGKTVPVKSAMMQSLRIGKATFTDKEIVVIDLGPNPETLCGTPGVIGHDILQDYILEIDYRAKTVTFDKHLNPQIIEKNGVEWIHFQYVKDTHLMRIPVHINDKGPFEIILDTGASGTVITPSLAAQLGITEALPKDIEGQNNVQAKGCEQGVCPGVGGVATGFGATLKQLSVGTATQENVPVGVINLKIMSPRGEPIDYGVLGYPFLKNYTLVIDYPRSRFAMIN
ncbi:MAG: aspartyl protease family protein [Candidatus Thorarchaeota archaeon]